MQFPKHFLLLLILMPIIACQNNKKTVDLLIENGTVYDGVGKTPKSITIGITGDKITYLGNRSGVEADDIIDANGLIVAPGFIDPHTHADRDMDEADKSHNQSFLWQGVTTIIAGNDGSSFFPFSDYKQLYEQHGIGTNAVLLTGHGTLRRKVLGKSDRLADEAAIAKMQAYLKKEMEAGSFGLSTGLFYAPGSYSNTKEVIALAKTAAEMGGIYDTHLRDESSYTVGLVAAVKEAIEIGKQTNIPIHISHIKCLGVDVWGKSETVIELVENAQKAGVMITANQYPYDASATGLLPATVPRWAESGGTDSLFLRYNNPKIRERILVETIENIRRRGGADKLLIVGSKNSIYVGKNLAEIASELDLPAEKAVYEVLKSGHAQVASFNMNPADIQNFMQQNWVMIGSDGNTGHPRKYGTFPRVYHKYVQQDKILDLGEFIQKSTAKTAEIFQIPKRGTLAEGFFADLIIFDPTAFKDKADYTDAYQYAEGLKYSILNGEIIIENGVYNGKLAGRVLVRE